MDFITESAQVRFDLAQLVAQGRCLLPCPAFFHQGCLGQIVTALGHCQFGLALPLDGLRPCGKLACQTGPIRREPF